MPQFKYKIGETFGSHTHKLLTDPAVPSSGNPVLSDAQPPLAPPPKTQEDFFRSPVYSSRTRSWGDQKLVPQMIPGYTGKTSQGRHSAIAVTGKTSQGCHSAIAVTGKTSQGRHSAIAVRHTVSRVQTSKQRSGSDRLSAVQCHTCCIEVLIITTVLMPSHTFAPIHCYTL